MRALACLVLLGMVSCASQEARWHADKRFTTAEMAAIESGLEWLQSASRHDMSGIGFDYEVTSETPLEHTIRRESPKAIEPNATGLCSGSTVYLDVDGAGPYLEGLTAHELGHCELGLRDDFESEGIMHKLDPMRWTEREEAQCHTCR